MFVIIKTMSEFRDLVIIIEMCSFRLLENMGVKMSENFLGRKQFSLEVRDFRVKITASH